MTDMPKYDKKIHKDNKNPLKLRGYNNKMKTIIEIWWR